MASPSMTLSNAAGNLLAPASIAAAGNTSFNLDVTSRFEAQVQVTVTFGAVAATAGLQIDAFRRIGAGPVNDTIAVTTLVIQPTASTTQARSFALPTGRWVVKLTNLDATNGVTGVGATDDTVDSVA